MTKYKNKSMLSSFGQATRGLLIALKSQRTMRIGILISAIVLVTAVILRFSLVEMTMIFIAAGFVLFAEMINTVIEFVIDTYFRNKYSEIARMSKDIAAGAVLFTIFVAAVIGLVLFIPKITQILL